MSDQQLVDMMEQQWQSISQLGVGLSEAEWKTPTDCPHWSVQDQLSHIVGSESRLLGRPAPDHTPADTSHVRNESGQRNEIVVDWRRSWPGSKTTCSTLARIYAFPRPTRRAPCAWCRRSSTVWKRR